MTHCTGEAVRVNNGIQYACSRVMDTGIWMLQDLSWVNLFRQNSAKVKYYLSNEEKFDLRVRQIMHK